MKPNRIREIWAGGGTAINGWLAIPEGFAAEILAAKGWDCVTVDMQHGLIDYQAMVRLLTAVATTGTQTMVRVPWNEPGVIMKALDAGAYGIICPMINTAEEAAQFVAWTTYAPKGSRSNGPIRAALHLGLDYQANADRTILRLAMIETKTALENLDAILATPGLDGIYVGPSDLSLSFGCRPVLEGLDPPAEAAVQAIADRARAAGIPAGIHCATVEGALNRVRQGFRLVTVGSDAVFIGQGAAATVAGLRKGLGA